MTLKPQSPQLSIAEEAALEANLNSLSAKKTEWAQLPISEYIEIIDEILREIPAVEAAWIAACLDTNGGQPGSLTEAEAWFNLSIIYRLLRFLRASLARLAKDQSPFPPQKLHRNAFGHLEAPLLPSSLFDRFSLPGIHASVWLDTENNSQAAAYQHPSQGSLCMIFGAGNVPAVVPIDLLHKLFVERQVVIVKTNPVNENMLPSLKRIFDPLIRRGYLQIISGDIAEGGYLAHHPQVDELHITGSDRTYEAILFGPGEAGQRRKAQKKPLLTKRFTAELGNISPVIIVPGPWSEADLRYQSRKIGSWLMPNSGHNCVTPHVLINHQNWDQRQSLNQFIASFLNQNPARDAYYPGSRDLHRAFLNAHPDALQLGQPQEDFLPWTFIPDLDPNDREEICFNREAFFGFFSETGIEAESIPDYISKAVEFTNQTLWGTLTAAIVVHPQSLKDPVIAQAVEMAINELDYGTITLNHWGALPYFLAISPWGGAPGHDIYDIQSGMDWVNNPFMFDAPIKSVIRAPFRQIPDPFMADAPNSLPYFKRDTRFQSQPNAANLTHLLWAALRS